MFCYSTPSSKADLRLNAKDVCFVDREKDNKKAEALFQKINELEKRLGPEYLALIEATKDVDPNSKDAQDIVSMFDERDESCPD